MALVHSRVSLAYAGARQARRPASFASQRAPPPYKLLASIGQWKRPFAGSMATLAPGGGIIAMGPKPLAATRPAEPAHARVLPRSGRRFQVEVTPQSAAHRADAVLASLRAKRR